MLSLQATSLVLLIILERKHTHTTKLKDQNGHLEAENATTTEVDRGNSAINHNNNYY